MAEWLKAHAWKACIRATVSWVRIPLPPPSLKATSACVLGRNRPASPYPTRLHHFSVRRFTQMHQMAVAAVLRPHHGNQFGGEINGKASVATLGPGLSCRTPSRITSLKDAAHP